MFNSSPLLVFVMIFHLVVSVASAKLKFPLEAVHHRASIGEASFTAVFPFKNEGGSEPVILLGAASDCDCTVPTFEGAEYLPGEKGIITATFNYGELQGIHEKRIKLLTNEGNYELLLSVDIPVFWRVTPKALIWKKEASPESKDIMITFPESAPKKLSLANSVSANFSIEWDWKEGEERCLVRVTPKDTKVNVIKKIDVEVVFEDQVSAVIPLLLRIAE